MFRSTSNVRMIKDAWAAFENITWRVFCLSFLWKLHVQDRDGISSGAVSERVLGKNDAMVVWVLGAWRMFEDVARDCRWTWRSGTATCATAWTTSRATSGSRQRTGSRCSRRRSRRRSSPAAKARATRVTSTTTRRKCYASRPPRSVPKNSPSSKPLVRPRHPLQLVSYLSRNPFY